MYKKYHSGLMCKGVLNGFAGMKLSGSPNIQGLRWINNIYERKKDNTHRVSLMDNKGWNLIISKCGFAPIEDLDPLVCRVAMWTILMIIMMKGRKK